MKSLILVLCLSLCVQYSFGQEQISTHKNTEVTTTATPSEVQTTVTPSEVTTTATPSEATTTANTPGDTTAPAENNPVTSKSTKAPLKTKTSTVAADKNTKVTTTATPSEVQTTVTPSEVTTTATPSEATTTANTPGDTTTPGKNNLVTNESTKAPLRSNASAATSKKLETLSDKRLWMMYHAMKKLMKQRGLFKISQPPTTTAPPTTNAPAVTNAPADVNDPADGNPTDDDNTDPKIDNDSKDADGDKDTKNVDGDKDTKDVDIPVSTIRNKTPDSSHFAVVFLVLIALLFGLYALYHNRGKIIAVVVEGRSGAGNRGARDRYRKLDNNSEDPEARIKNSNEVYVY